MVNTRAKVNFRAPDKDLIDLNPTNGSIFTTYSTRPISAAFDRVRTDADSKSVRLDSKDGASLDLIASLNSPTVTAKPAPNLSAAFDLIHAAKPPSIPAAAKTHLTKAQRDALTAATAAIDAAILDIDPDPVLSAMVISPSSPVVLTPEIPKPILPIPSLPEPSIVVSGIDAVSKVASVEPSVVLSTDAQIDVLFASVVYNPPRRPLLDFAREVFSTLKELFEEFSYALNEDQTEDALGFKQRPNSVGFGLTAAFSSVAAIGALIIALNPFGVKQNDNSFALSASISAPTTISQVVADVQQTPTSIELPRSVSFVPPTPDMVFDSPVSDSPRRLVSPHRNRSYSPNRNSSALLIKVDSIAVVSHVSPSKGVLQARSFVGEVVGDSNLSNGSVLAGPQLIISRTLTRMGLSMSDLPTSVSNQISGNTLKNLTAFAALLEADAFRMIPQVNAIVSADEKSDIWMHRASLNASRIATYVDVLRASGLFN